MSPGLPGLRSCKPCASLSAVYLSTHERHDSAAGPAVFCFPQNGVFKPQPGRSDGRGPGPSPGPQVHSPPPPRSPVGLPLLPHGRRWGSVREPALMDPGKVSPRQVPGPRTVGGPAARPPVPASHGRCRAPRACIPLPVVSAFLVLTTPRGTQKRPLFSFSSSAYR